MSSRIICLTIYHLISSRLSQNLSHSLPFNLPTEKETKRWEMKYDLSSIMSSYYLSHNLPSLNSPSHLIFVSQSTISYLSHDLPSHYLSLKPNSMCLILFWPVKSKSSPKLHLYFKWSKDEVYHIIKSIILSSNIISYHYPSFKW